MRNIILYHILPLKSIELYEKNEKYIIELKLDFQDQRLREKAIETGIADVISKAIGSKIVLYKKSQKKPKIEIPVGKNK